MNENLLKENKKNETVLIEKIEESDKFIKYILNITLLGGSIGFLSAGTSSYFNYNLLPIFTADKIIFFPQGLTMCFYGFFGTLLGLNQLRILNNKIGEGFNEFNKELGIMRVYRKGQQSDINITYPLKDIEAIKLDLKTDLFNTNQKIYVCIKGKNDLPIIQIDKPKKITELEEKASEIASFLKVPVKST